MPIEKIIACLLEKNSKEKIALLEYISNRPPVQLSVYQLSCALKMHSQKITQLLLEINSDFLTLGWECLLTDTGGVVWSPDKVKITSYSRYLLRQSLIYQMIKTILLQPNCGINYFMQEQYVSRSTTIRRAQPLKQLLKESHIHLNSSKMTLEGPEEAIQNFLFACFWYASFGEDLISSNEDWHLERELLSLPEISRDNFFNQKCALLCLMIARYRLQQGYQLSVLDYPAPIFPQKQQLLKDYLKEVLPNASSKNLNDYSLFLYYKISGRLIDSEKDSRLQQIMALYQQGLAKKEACSELTQQFSQGLARDYFFVPLGPEEQAILQANIFLVLRLVKTPYLLDFIHMQTAYAPKNYQDKEFLRLLDFCYSFANRLTEELALESYATLEQKKRLAIYITEIIYPCVKTHCYTSILSVGIQALSNRHLMIKLISFLNQICFVQYEFLEKDGQYDFCIGDNEADIINCREFYLLSYKNEDFEGELFQKLLTCLQSISMTEK